MASDTAHLTIPEAYRLSGGRGSRQCAYRWAHAPGGPPLVYLSPRRIVIAASDLDMWARSGGAHPGKPSPARDLTVSDLLADEAPKE